MICHFSLTFYFYSRITRWDWTLHNRVSFTDYLFEKTFESLTAPLFTYLSRSASQSFRVGLFFFYQVITNCGILKMKVFCEVDRVLRPLKQAALQRHCHQFKQRALLVLWRQHKYEWCVALYAHIHVLLWMRFSVHAIW